MSDTPAGFEMDGDDYMEVETHTVEWGIVSLAFCPECLVTHEWCNVYTYPSSGNPMEAELLGPLWLCDDFCEEFLCNCDEDEECTCDDDEEDD